MSRTIAFFPFFLAGYFFNKNNGFSLPKINIFLLSIGLFFIFIFSLLTKSVDVRFLYLYSSYKSLGLTNFEGAILRAIQLIVGAIGVYCVVGISRSIAKIDWISQMGRYSMAPYILHMFALIFAKKIGFLNYVQNMRFENAFIFTFLCVSIMVVVFSVVGKYMNFLFNYSWLKANNSSIK